MAPWLNYMALSSQKYGLASGEQREMVRNTSGPLEALTFILSMEAHSQLLHSPPCLGDVVGMSCSTSSVNGFHLKFKRTF